MIDVIMIRKNCCVHVVQTVVYMSLYIHELYHALIHDLLFIFAWVCMPCLVCIIHLQIDIFLKEVLKKI